jgi:hypothetical protein
MSTLTFDASAFLKRLDSLDRALVACGFHPMSPWWRAEIERFLRSGKKRWIVRAGRRAGKSSTLARLACAWALWGPWSVPTGDVGVVAFVSINREEASARLRTIREVLRAIGVGFTERDQQIELVDRPVAFRVTTCSIDAVGFTSIAVFGDEVSRWEDRDGTANPAKEVIGSLGPTLATQPFGFMCLCSAPWSISDFHAQEFDRGETEHQQVSFAESWVANPTLTEDSTHALEPDLRVWSREYAARPGSVETAALDPSDVDALFVTAGEVRAPRNYRGAYSRSFLLCDPSTLVHDDFAFMIGTETDDRGVQILEIGGVSAEYARSRAWNTAHAVAHIAERAKQFGVKRAYGDSFNDCASHFAQHDIDYRTQKWTRDSKAAGFATLRDAIRIKKICAPEHVKLRQQMVELRERLTPTGVAYATNGQDYLACLFALGIAISEKEIKCEAKPPSAHTLGLRKMATDPQRAVNRLAGLAGTAPFAVSRGARPCKNCRRYSLSGNCCDAPRF